MRRVEINTEIMHVARKRRENERTHVEKEKEKERKVKRNEEINTRKRDKERR